MQADCERRCRKISQVQKDERGVTGILFTCFVQHSVMWELPDHHKGNSLDLVPYLSFTLVFIWAFTSKAALQNKYLLRKGHSFYLWGTLGLLSLLFTVNSRIKILRSSISLLYFYISVYLCCSFCSWIEALCKSNWNGLSLWL